MIATLPVPPLTIPPKAAVAQPSFMDSPPIQRTPTGMMVQPETPVLLAQLFRDQLQLEENQVLIYNQDWKIPPDNRLYVVVNFLSSRPFSGTGPGNGSTDAAGDFVENQSYTIQETYSVHIFSSTAEARQRKEELLFALGSIAAEQMAEKYALRFPRLPVGFNDASETEGSARLNRYVLTIAILRGYARQKVIQPYTDFNGSPAIVSQP